MDFLKEKMNFLYESKFCWVVIELILISILLLPINIFIKSKIICLNDKCIMCITHLLFWVCIYMFGTFDKSEFYKDKNLYFKFVCPLIFMLLRSYRYPDFLCRLLFKKNGSCDIYSDTIRQLYFLILIMIFLIYLVCYIIKISNEWSFKTVFGICFAFFIVGWFNINEVNIIAAFAVILNTLLSIDERRYIVDFFKKRKLFLNIIDKYTYNKPFNEETISEDEVKGKIAVQKVFIYMLILILYLIIIATDRFNFITFISKDYFIEGGSFYKLLNDFGVSYQHLDIKSLEFYDKTINTFFDYIIKGYIRAFIVVIISNIFLTKFKKDLIKIFYIDII